MPQTVRRGTWLYGGTLPAEVRIVKSVDWSTDGIVVEDDLADPSYPPRDPDGFSYGVEYYLRGVEGRTSKGVSAELFASLEDAVRHAETTLREPIKWD